MKNLVEVLEFVSKDTIYEKLDLNKINLHDKFPMDSSFDDILDFLIRHNFKPIQFNQKVNSVWRDIVKAFNKENTRCILASSNYYDNTNIIRFADMKNGKISENNPMFFIRDEFNKRNFCISTSYFQVLKLNPDEWIELLNQHINL